MCVLSWIDEDYVPSARELELMAGFTGEAGARVIMVGANDFGDDDEAAAIAASLAELDAKSGPASTSATGSSGSDSIGMTSGAIEADDELTMELAKMESIGDVPDATFAGVDLEGVSCNKSRAFSV